MARSVSESDSSEGRNYSASPLDAVEAVRRHPEWFFADRKFDTTEAIALLVEEATRGGASAVDIRTDRGWVRVAADVDWLEGDAAAFFAPLSYRAGGRNSSRVEVALTAFCDAVVTATSQGVYQVKSMEQAAGMEQLLTGGRTVAFLPPSEARLSAADNESRAAPPSSALRLVQGEGPERIAAAVKSFLKKQQSA